MEKLTFIKVETEAQKRLFETLLVESEIALRKKGIPFMWEFADLVYDKLTKNGGEAYMGYLKDIPVTTVIGFDEDFDVWPDKVGVDKAYYLHKITVRPGYGGRGFAHLTLAHMKEVAKEKGKDYLRLDCRYNRDKLKQLYTSFGLEIVGRRQMPFDELALLEMELK